MFSDPYAAEFADDFIDELNLQEHPEGGYYREYYRSQLTADCPQGKRQLLTAIYFLLKGTQTSAFHKLCSDEIWAFHEGTGILLHLIDPNGNYSLKKLGRYMGDGEELQITIPANTWFAAELTDKDCFSIVSCFVSPGFDFADFDMPEQQELINRFPQHRELITKLS